MCGSLEIVGVANYTCSMMGWHLHWPFCWGPALTRGDVTAGGFPVKNRKLTL